jgi:hypothetical protein
VKARGGEPGDGASEAVADDADLLARHGGGKVDGCGDVDDGFIRIKLWDETHRGLHIGSFITQLDTRLEAIEKRRRNSEKSVVRPAIGHGANVGVDAEDFLHNDQAGDWFGCRAGDIGAEGVAVGGTQSYSFTHGQDSSTAIPVSMVRGQGSSGAEGCAELR